MITAYQLVDFDNDKSMFYHERSIASFIDVTNLNIIPIQCITPDELEGWERDLEMTWMEYSYASKYVSNNKRHKFTKTERCVAASHFMLWQKQLREADQFIIMEHDAYLRPHHVLAFRSEIKSLQLYGTWNRGLCAECYTINPTILNWAHNNNRPALYEWGSGVMGHVQALCDLYYKKVGEPNNDGLVYNFPLSSHPTREYNVIYSSSIPSIYHQAGPLTPLTTQLYCKELGNTISHGTIEPDEPLNEALFEII